MCYEGPPRVAHQPVRRVPLRLGETDALRTAALRRQKGIRGGRGDHVKVQQLPHHVRRGARDHLHDLLVDAPALVLGHGLRLRDAGHEVLLAAGVAERQEEYAAPDVLHLRRKAGERVLVKILLQPPPETGIPGGGGGVDESRGPARGRGKGLRGRGQR